MINFDPIILPKAISNKLKAVLPTLISSQETAYIKTFIWESGRLISNINYISDWFNIEEFHRKKHEIFH